MISEEFGELETLSEKYREFLFYILKTHERDIDVSIRYLKRNKKNTWINDYDKRIKQLLRNASFANIDNSIFILACQTLEVDPARVAKSIQSKIFPKIKKVFVELDINILDYI